MSVCTFGLYEFYWFYRNWKLEQARTGKILWPGLRASFAPVTAYGFFKSVVATAGEYGVVIKNMNPAVLAAAYAALWILRMGDSTGVTYFLSFIPLLFINRLASGVNSAIVPDYRENSRFTFWNIVTVLVGGAMIVLGVGFGLMGGGLSDFSGNGGENVTLDQLMRLRDQM